MAAGETLNIFTPLDNQPPASNYATLDTRNAHAVLDYDAATDENAVFGSVLPRHYAGGGLTITCYCMMSTATSGNVILQASVERMDTSTDLDADSFASAQSSSATAVNGTSGATFTVTITLTAGAQMDSLAAGEAFRLKIGRDADNASDTATGDLELSRVEVRET